MPQTRVRSTSQSSAGSDGSGMSRRLAGEKGPRKKRLSIRPRRLDTICRGTLTSQTRARMLPKAKQSAVRDASAARIAGASLRQRPPLGHDARVAASSRPHRAIPSVERLLHSPAAGRLVARWRRERVVEVVRGVLRDVRATLNASGTVPADEVLLARTADRLEAAATPRLTRVINATGVVLHTNLGRAPLSETAIE